MRDASLKIFQIVPTLPPVVGGVGDYAVILARAMTPLGYDTHFITLKGGEGIVDFVSDRVDHPRVQSLVALLDSVEAQTVILHHSPYGYARYGLCGWLGKALGVWRRASDERRLILILHELSATGSFFSTAYWAGMEQLRIARHLVSEAHAVFTTSEATCAEVTAWREDIPIVTTAVFSNVGELTNPLPLSERNPYAVVFGGAARRKNVYARLAALGDDAERSLASYGISRIIDVGSPIENCPPFAGGVPVEVRGILSAQQISNALGSSRIGIVDYPHHVFTKSGIVAAYLAHAMLCLNLSSVGSLPFDLEVGREFVDWATFRNGVADFQSAASAGHRWYCGHSVANVTQAILESLTVQRKEMGWETTFT